MDIFSILKLIGGLAIFLFGMSVMGDALEKRSGGKLKIILESLTSSPIKGLLLGLGVTAVIQSSSATTVMLVGFVNSGIMKLSQSIAVIFGANLGTTITAWLLSLTGISGDSFFVQILKPSSFTPILAVVGIIMFMSKKEKSRDTGGIFLGFATLMFGMDAMSGAVSALKDNEAFANMMLLFSNPLLGILAGALVTAVVQSSSASIGILQALSTTGNLTYTTIIPIVLGQNIGTCITAILAAIGVNKAAKRVAAVHLIFNLIGCTLFMIVYSLIKSQLAFLGNIATPFGIAVFHSVFNLFAVTVLFPFRGVIEKLAIHFVKDSKEEEEFNLLDERLLETPSIAIAQCEIMAGKMIDAAHEGMTKAISLLDVYTSEGFDEVVKYEDKTDKFEDRIGSYMIKLSSRSLSAQESQEVSKLLNMIGDFERIGDHAVNIAEAASEIHDKKLVFSDEANKELKVMTDAVREILKNTIESFKSGNIEGAKRVEPLEEVIDSLKITLKKNHIERLREGKCSIETGFVFSDIVTNYERVADHCSNIAICLIQIKSGDFEAHMYLDSLDNAESEAFNQMYKKYKIKYEI